MDIILRLLVTGNLGSLDTTQNICSIMNILNYTMRFNVTRTWIGLQCKYHIVDFTS